MAEHFETWLDLASAGQFDGHGDHDTPAPYVETAFRKYLECGIFANGFARARCDNCGHDYVVDFSCKGRRVCPSCNTRRMAEAAAHLTDHVFPHLPVRQWVLSVPKRLRGLQVIGLDFRGHGLARNLGITLVAAGIPSLQQLAFLKNSNVDQCQGLLFNNPMPAAEFE